MTDLIKAENLTRYYDQHCAVNDVSFTLSKGEVLGFLGPNGAGKTTTMQLLCGNLAPNAGSIHINGIDLLKNPNAAKVNLGYLPDTPPLYKDLTVNEFLTYCGQLHRVPKAQIAKALEVAKERCALSDVADRLIGNLSKGYQQRVGIAQAILHNPAVIILDEPTVGLDPLQIREIRLLIRELGQDHGIILSTHILSEVQESCTHVQIIQAGRLILKTSINDLNKQLQATGLNIVTRSPMDVDKLSLIDGVTAIEVLSPCHVRVQHAEIGRANPPEAIAAMIVSCGWGLQEITPIQNSLEDEYIRLTQSQTPL
ncbi:MAG: ABC transporter ATP-binding protein [Methylococcaceae bacterium]|nr:ABC transporter ATP-binding protein [Methylococcaceae bacterium]